MKVALVSLGCPKNLVDSEKMLAQLARGGCLVGCPMDMADVIVINTCGFIQPARDESLELIGEAVGYKRSGRARRVVVAGCLASRDGAALMREVPGIDALVGVNDRHRLLSAVLAEGRTSKLARKLTSAGGGGAEKSEIYGDRGRFRLTPRHTAYLRISEGCSRRCTFCTIPSIRGAFRSKPPKLVLQEAAELVADGAVELNIIGQDTTSFGCDLAEKTDLADLLLSLEAIEGLKWIRLLYAYPSRLTRRLIDVMGRSEKIVPYIDLPLQHISDGVLRRMGRGTSKKSIRQLLARIRSGIPAVSVRTTFIVGFPGESRDDFDQLVDFVRSERFAAVGVFEFSPEVGTAAFAMDGQVDDSIKASRARRLMAVQKRVVLADNRQKVGSTIKVLVDGQDNHGRCVGRHAGQAPDIDSLCYLSATSPAGRFVRAAVSGFDEYDLIVKPL